MTEDEAKTKWCPAFRGNDHGINRRFELETASIGNCLGSACMAWRWAKGVSVAEAAAKIATEGGDWRCAIALRDAQEAMRPDDGFCGLAGAPQ